MLKFSVGTIKTELHWSFLLLLGLIILSGNSIFAGSSALFSMLHELVHARTAQLLGYTPEKISAGLFGGILHVREGFIRPLDELLIHLSGPFFNLALAAGLYGGVALLESILFPVPAFWTSLILSNLVLGIFNLMPFYPLDGGKITRLYLAFFLGYGRALKISRGISLLFSLLLFLAGIYLMQYNIINLLISALAVNLYIAGREENSFIFYKVAKNIEGTSVLNKKARMQVCRKDARAFRVLETYRPLESRLFTIVDDRGSYKGQLSEEELLQGIYDCGIYADFEKLLDHKRKKRRKNEFNEKTG